LGRFRSKLIACGHWFLKSQTGKKIYKWGQKARRDADKTRAQRMKENNPSVNTETVEKKTKTPA
jgi:hypothetical protein